MTEYDKPIPQPDPFVGKPYWDGGKEGKLMLPRCTSCSKTHFYPRAMCPHCGRNTIEWYEASGFGILHTFAVQHRGVGAWRDHVPYVTAFIDLMEGDRVFTVLRGVDPNKPEEIKIGSKCRIEWDQASEEVYMPYWRVVEE